MAEPISEAALATSSDAWLGGRLTLRQPRKGHRVGSDAILLAAAAPQGGRIVDVGAGVGAVAFALLRRFDKAHADLVEVDADLADLAKDNAEANGLAARTRIVIADVTAARARRASGLRDEAANVVVTNPPFFSAADVRASPEPRRARAHVLGADDGQDALARWIAASLALLAPGGRFIMIHRPEALAQILASFENRLGAVAILPVHPRADAPAHRLLLTGVKGARAPLSLKPALTLHDEAGAFTPLAEALHRGDAAIDWGLD